MGNTKDIMATANNCVFCGARPIPYHYEENMWYVLCGNKNCSKHDKYAYLGTNLSRAIEQWNYINRKNILRKRPKDEDNNI